MKCEPGCTCGRHTAGPKIAAALTGLKRPCPQGCTCKRHLPHSPTCRPGCTCKRHVIGQERRDRIGAANKGRVIKHGLTNHPLFGTWWRMMNRCFNPNSSGFEYWGGRGITVCEEWRDCAAFVAWMESPAGIGHRPEGRYSLDRVDNEGDYEPGNVRWATDSEQNSNRRHFTRRG